jgi:hypothetical protein
MPFPRDFAAEARNRRTNEKIAKPVISRRYDFGTSTLCPGDEEGLSLVRTLDSDPPSRRRERAIFCGVCGELVQQQRQAGNHGRIDFHVASGDGEF